MNTQFHDLVNELFRTRRNPKNNREYTNSEVSRMLNGELTPDYLSKLRRGDIPNPGWNTILLLCKFFAVPSSYFFPELDIPVQEVLTEEEIREEIASRAGELSYEARVFFTAFLRFFKGK